MDRRKPIFTKKTTPKKQVDELNNEDSQKIDEKANSIENQIHDEESSNKESQVKDVIQNLQDEKSKLKEKLLKAEFRLSESQSKYKNAIDRIEQLEQISKEKSEQIAQLQRNANVELWEIEKRKILERAGLGGNNLSGDIAKQHEQEKSTLKTKIKELEMQLKKEKMTLQLGLSRDERESELEDAKKYTFVLEKDLKKLDDDLYNVQKCSLGLLEGLHTKFSSVLDKFRDNQEQTRNTTNIDLFDDIATILYKSSEAMAHGEIDKYVKSLGKDFDVPPSHIKSVIARKLATNFATRGRITCNMPANDNLNKPSTSQEENSPSPKRNPELVDPLTNHINMTTVIRHFPFMIQTDIEMLWKQFSHYDKNSDGTLDMVEVMTAICSNVDNKFTAPQIKEAITEVDSNEDGLLDFFEYVCIAKVLQEKSGRSRIYHHKELQTTKDGQLTKVCSIM